MTPEQRAALMVLRQELEDSIDGGEECRGHDTRITRQITLVELVLGIGVNPWAAMQLEPDIKAMKAKL